MIELVAFDADDTLWHSENLFTDAHARFDALLAQYGVDPSPIASTVLATERRNLDLFGYGVKGFTLSLIESAIELTEGRVDAAGVQAILDLGKEMLGHPVEMLDGADQVVREVARQRRTLIVTKGDLFHQESKVARSGLGEVVDDVEILAEKDPATYRRMLARHDVSPERFAMVGNSVRSDILPIVELGGTAIHVPYAHLWDHEAVPDAEPSSHGYRVASSIRDVPRLLGIG